MASLYLESLRGVHAHLKPLQASVEVSTEHAPPQGLYVEVSHVHCNSSCWNFLAKVSRELFSRAGITAAKALSEYRPILIPADKSLAPLCQGIRAQVTL